ncbi:MAG: leucyl/phenylalanyl-tRNA--protein transferase [bacterium]
MLPTRASGEWFPPLHAASEEGLLAVGGDLSEQRLLAAYRRGIFPWYGPGEPILWWSPDPRCVIFPDKFEPSRSLRKSIRRYRCGFRLDTAFERVIAECAAPRDNNNDDDDTNGTWISDEMMRAYIGLHRRGVAHSAEVWRRGELIGGLYGIALGGAFFGESMFSRAADASKVALALLIEQLLRRDFRLIDCQVCSPHLLRLGAEPIARERFIARLESALRRPGWSDGANSRG